MVWNSCECPIMPLHTKHAFDFWWFSQQLLQVLWKAGWTKQGLRGQRIGSFMGDSGSEWNVIYLKKDRYQLRGTNSWNVVGTGWWDRVGGEKWRVRKVEKRKWPIWMFDSHCLKLQSFFALNFPFLLVFYPIFVTRFDYHSRKFSPHPKAHQQQWLRDLLQTLAYLGLLGREVFTDLPPRRSPPF